nr:hydramacin-1-like [Pocillopora verrucosa]
MAFRHGYYFFVLTIVVVTILNTSVAEGSCFTSRLRCSRWGRWFTGKLWKNCNDYCIELGYYGGSCQICRKTCWLSSKAYSCRCFGTGLC